MNKRRRYRAKWRRMVNKIANRLPNLEYQTCSDCGDYIMACICSERKIPYTQVNQSMDEWLGFRRSK